MGLFKRKPKGPTEHEKRMAQWKMEEFKNKLTRVWTDNFGTRKLDEVWKEIRDYYSREVPEELRGHYNKVKGWILENAEKEKYRQQSEIETRRKNREAYDREQGEVKRYFETYGHVSPKHSKQGWFVITSDDPEKGRVD